MENTNNLEYLKNYFIVENFKYTKAERTVQWTPVYHHPAQ